MQFLLAALAFHHSSIFLLWHFANTPYRCYVCFRCNITLTTQESAVTSHTHLNDLTFHQSALGTIRYVFHHIPSQLSVYYYHTLILKYQKNQVNKYSDCYLSSVL